MGRLERPERVTYSTEGDLESLASEGGAGDEAEGSGSGEDSVE